MTSGNFEACMQRDRTRSGRNLGEQAEGFCGEKRDCRTGNNGTDRYLPLKRSVRLLVTRASPTAADPPVYFQPPPTQSTLAQYKGRELVCNGVPVVAIAC